MAVLAPFICGTTPPTISVNNEIGHSVITIQFHTGPDTSTHFQSYSFVHKFGPNQISTNPFYATVGVTGNVEYNSEGTDFSISASGSLKDNYCTAHTHFRSVSMDQGLLAKFHDTAYLESDSIIDVSFRIVGRCRYQGSINYKNSGTTHVKFYLPDTLYNGHFVAFDTKTGGLLLSSWDSINKKITITFHPGVTEFYIQLDNPCQLNCFFPPTAKTIDSIFNFDNGLIEYLDHNLDVKLDSGRLNILGGSVMSICSHHYLTNHDTIFMRGYMDANDSFNAIRHDTCTDAVISSPFFKNTGRDGSGRSMIKINNAAALLLLNGSHTILDANSTIWVKSGGTLYIQNGANVIIGGPGQPGYAEVYADPGAYVCIESGANVSFYANPNDSTDKNILYLPAGFHGGTITAGKNTDATLGIFHAPFGLYATGSCTPICSLKNNSIVQNPAYGWFNAGTPFAYIDVPDTFCLGDTVGVSSRFSRNVAWFKFTVCEWDTLAHICIGLPTDLSMCDTGRADYCNLTHKYTWLAGHTYKLTLKVYNECGVEDDTFRILYFMNKPTASFTLADSACPGVGTFTANGSASIGSKYHIWTVSSMDPPANIPDSYDSTSAHDTSYTVNGAVSSSFGFPGFKFTGGKKYIISLTVYNHCGSTTKTDTIKIPVAAVILNSKPALIYTSGVGPTSITLHGQIAGTTNYIWKYRPYSGGAYLTISGTLNPSFSPFVKSIYVLRDSNGSCKASDTLIVNINMYANAGNDTTVCRGDSAKLGVPGLSLPPGWYAFWQPNYHIGSSSSLYTKARPDSTVTYKLFINNPSDITVETATKTIYIDTLPAAGFIGQYSGQGYNFCFDNESFPYSPATTYKWHFGDGDSSMLANPCHRYAYVGHDTTYRICLKVKNSCGDSTICDSIFIPADSSAIHALAPHKQATNPAIYQSGNGVFNYTIPGLPLITSILTVVPNPTSGLTSVHYTIGAGETNPRLLVFDMNGRVIKTYNLNPKSNAIDIDLTNMLSGIYPAYIITDRSLSKTTKIVIARQ